MLKQYLLLFQIDKGHCKIAYETDEDISEFDEFYDFTSSYPADNDDNWVFVSDDEAENDDDELPKT